MSNIPTTYRVLSITVKPDGQRVSTITSAPSDAPLPVPELGDVCDVGTEGCQATCIERHTHERPGDVVTGVVWRITP